MFCSNCSNPVDSKTKFCPYCDAAIEEIIEPNAPGDHAVPRSTQLSSLAKRYSDAYLVSSVTDGFGKLIKGIGLLLGGILVLAGFGLISQGRLGDATVALGVLTLALGVISGLWFYMVGVLVSANAQVLKASLDSAVNTSPFLTNEHRAKIMSIPQS
jgi:hypothetical protein